NRTEGPEMTDVEPVVTDFAATGRTGWRNAMPDILGSTAGPGAADLPNKLAELSVGASQKPKGPKRRQDFLEKHYPYGCQEST
uniref:Protein kinase (cAMP-dependent, catalytic) inhibitor beta n=1 Tax=Pygocentrus nattereri TaxID=42514 RepID=A0A3B4CBY1_PYGNA